MRVNLSRLALAKEKLDGFLAIIGQAIFVLSMSLFARESYHILFNLDKFGYSWKGLKILLIWFFGSLFFAAILSPFAYGFVIWWHTNFPNDLNTYLTEKPFPQYFDRLRWLAALLAIPWMISQCRLLSSWKLGFISEYPWHRNFGRFLLIGFCGVALVVALHQLVGASTFREGLTLGFVIEKILFSFLAAVLVALGEELVFRAVVLRMFYTAFIPVAGVLLSALFFAFLHFKMSANLWDPGTEAAGVVDGLYVALWTVLGITQQFSLVTFLNLTLVGYILSVVFMRTRSLWASIGLHAGWVTLILSYSHIGETPSGNTSVWWGSHRIADGYLCLVVLLIIAWVVTSLNHPRWRSPINS